MKLLYINQNENDIFTTISYAEEDTDHTDKLCECKIDVSPETKT